MTSSRKPHDIKALEELRDELLVAEARSEAGPSQDRWRERFRATGRPLQLALALTAAAIVIAATPTRDVVADWLHDLADVGESPTFTNRETTPAGTRKHPTIVSTGRAPEGTRYEIVSFLRGADEVCAGVDWPDQRLAVDACAKDNSLSALPIGPTSARAYGDEALVGTVEGTVGSAVDDVKTTLVTPNGESELESHLTLISGSGEDGFGVFLAFLPDDLGLGDLGSNAFVRIEAFDEEGGEVAEQTFPPDVED